MALSKVEGVFHDHLGAYAPPKRGWNDLLLDNQLGIIDNPVRYRNPDNLERDVQVFHEAHNLGDHVDLELLKRGARLAQDPRIFEAEDNLSVAERRALEREKNPRFRQQPKELQVILMTCCIGAIVQGWSQANITGANLHWPGDFGRSITRTDTYADHDGRPKDPDDILWPNVWIFGAVNSVTYFAASLIGAWLSDPLNEYFIGRRGALFVSGLFSLGAAVGAAFTQRWETLFLCRLLQGVGMGAKASVVPIYESEVAPAKIRGRMLVSWQTFTAFGIFLGFGANLIVNRYWRLQIGSGFIPAVPLLCLVFVCTESPRWLIKRGRYAEAFEALCRLRETPLQAARDLYNIHAQIQVEALLISNQSDLEEAFQDWSTTNDHTRYQEAVKKTSFFGRSLQLLTISRNRRASLAAAVAMVSQQLSGINIFAFLAATVLTNAGFGQIPSLWFSFGFAASNAIFSPVAYWFIDSKGRRFLLLWSLVAMVPLLLATGFSFQIDRAHAESSARSGAVCFFLILYAAAYSPGAGVVPFLYSSEVFPLINREVGMSLSCGINFLLAGVVAMTVQPLSITMGFTELLGLFAGLDAIAAILVWLFLPSTAEAATLEEMNYVFGVPTRKHVKYQLSTVLPWAVKQYIPWMVRHYLPCMTEHETEPPTIEPLYRWQRTKLEKRRQRELEKQEVRLTQLQSERTNQDFNDIKPMDERIPQLPMSTFEHPSSFPGAKDFVFPPPQSRPSIHVSAHGSHGEQIVYETNHELGHEFGHQ
ncbi:hypothetical protein VTO42DRAFT_6929 [Malbranchea cinnamomea]